MGAVKLSEIPLKGLWGRRTKVFFFLPFRTPPPMIEAVGLIMMMMMTEHPDISAVLFLLLKSLLLDVLRLFFQVILVIRKKSLIKTWHFDRLFWLTKYTLSSFFEFPCWLIDLYFVVYLKLFVFCILFVLCGLFKLVEVMSVYSEAKSILPNELYGFPSQRPRRKFFLIYHLMMIKYSVLQSKWIEPTRMSLVRNVFRMMLENYHSPMTKRWKIVLNIIAGC